MGFWKVFDTLLDIGCMFDWISPTVNEIQGYRNMVTGIPVDSAEAAYDVQDQLRKKGISSRVEKSWLSGWTVYTK